MRVCAAPANDVLTRAARPAPRREWRGRSRHSRWSRVSVPTMFVTRAGWNVPDLFRNDGDSSSYPCVARLRLLSCLAWQLALRGEGSCSEVCSISACWR